MARRPRHPASVREHPRPIRDGAGDGAGAEHTVRRAAALLAPRAVLVVVVWEAGAAYETLEGPTIPAAPLDARAALLADQAM